MFVITDLNVRSLSTKKAIAAQKKYLGYFALVSSCEKDPFDCLLKYRHRETIEFFFESGKQQADGSRTRVWSIYLSLQWFDPVEEVKVSTKLLSRRWTTEFTARDKLFLEKLGVPSF